MPNVAVRTSTSDLLNVISTFDFSHGTIPTGLIYAYPRRTVCVILQLSASSAIKGYLYNFAQLLTLNSYSPKDIHFSSLPTTTSSQKGLCLCYQPVKFASIFIPNWRRFKVCVSYQPRYSSWSIHDLIRWFNTSIPS